MIQLYGDIGDNLPVPTAEVLDRLITKHKIKTVIEIGSFQGCSACFFAHRVERVWCIDPFVCPPYDPWAKELRARNIPLNYYGQFAANVLKAGVSAKVIPIHRRSIEASSMVPSADLVYIDGDHSYEGCYSDIKLYKPKALKVLCGDDFHLREDGYPYYPGVHQAVKELCPTYQFGYYTWYVEK